jgi:hypothetical protein
MRVNLLREGESNEVADCYQNIGSNNWELGNLDKALSALNECQ